MYLINFPNGEVADFSPSEDTKLGRGATANVYRVEHLTNTFAVKLFIDTGKLNLEKIKSMISFGEQLKQSREKSFFKLLAWPEALVMHDGDIAGFAMPILDPTEFIGIDSFFDYNLRGNLPSSDFKSVSLLSNLITKFADVLAFLHEKNIHVVDLKPQNIKISKKDLSVHILDCDGFSIAGENGSRYPADLVSTDYIAPEALRKNSSPTSLGESQDRYALAVLIFQLLNKGIHPFQGVVTNKSLELNTNDDKAKARLYAYSLIPDSRINPHPRSVHRLFPSSLNELFEQAFTGIENSRPSARQWKEYFYELTQKGKLKRCINFPEDPLHIRFDNSDCIECYLQNIKTSTTWETGPKGRTAILPKSTPSSPPNPANPTNYTGLKAAFGFTLVFIGLFILLAVVSNSDDANSGLSSSNSADITATKATISEDNVAARSNSSEVAANQNSNKIVPNQNSNKIVPNQNSNKIVPNQNSDTYVNNLCSQATKTASDGSIQWDINAKYFLDQAKKKNLCCGVLSCSQTTSPSKHDTKTTMPSSTFVHDIEKCHAGYFSSCSREDLCSKATRKTSFMQTKRWTKRKRYLPFVDEAKRQGLSCGISTQAQGSSSDCDSSTAHFCSAKELCAKATATTRKFGKWNWDPSVKAAPYVSEAKRRKLNCAVTYERR